MFKRIDITGDKRVELYEFKAAVPMMNKWGVNIDDAEAIFKSIDTNGGGFIMFDEFCDWAIK
jgi:hypothetical protein